MNIAENFRLIEKNLGLFYPPSFYELLEEFVRISDRAEFQLVFKDAHLCSEIEIRHAINLIPEKLSPFFLEEHKGYNDYYCFDNTTPANGNRVVVFSRDAIVFDWNNFPDFISWLKKKLESKKSRGG